VAEDSSFHALKTPTERADFLSAAKCQWDYGRCYRDFVLLHNRMPQGGNIDERILPSGKDSVRGTVSSRDFAESIFSSYFDSRLGRARDE
jgi:hypothetical protein